VKKLYSVAIGTFDGVHKGHKYILNKNIENAKINNLKPLAIMLRYPMSQYVNGFTGLIYPSWEREKFIKKLGMDVETIDMQNVWNITHHKYLEILKERGVKYIVCGEDFRFGRGAIGDTSFLLKHAHRYGMQVNILHDLKNKGDRISSTMIRNSIKKGNIELANNMLERTWTLEGPVYEDRHIGQKLGFPTANIDIRYKEDIIFPKYGVYLVKGEIEGMNNQYWGLMNVGVRPTYFENKKIPKVEVYFLDFDYNIYNKYVKIEVINYMREEVKFNNEKDLIKAMNKDLENAKKIIY
jgi:riboflavin kinase/FMN adenylyltransferase